MGSIARRLGRWKTTDRELEGTVGERTRVTNRQSVDSGCSALSGLESQSSQSTQLTRSSRSNVSSRSTISEPDSPSKSTLGLNHKMSSVFSYFSETIRSTTSIFHPLEAGIAPSEPAELESPKKDKRHRSSISAVFRPSEVQTLPYKTTELETPKKHRRYSSVISSVRSRTSLSTPRARENQKCALSSPTSSVRTSQEQPPKLDVKIPNSFLSDERSRSTVATERSPTESLSKVYSEHPREATATCVRTPLRELCNSPPGMDGGFETDDDFLSRVNSAYCDHVIAATHSKQSMLGNNRHSLPDESNARIKASHEVLSAMLDNATPGSAGAEPIPLSLLELTPEFPLAAREDLEPGFESARDDLTLAHSPVPLPPDSSDLSPPRDDLPQTVASQDAYSLLITRHRQSCSDARFSLEDINLCDRLLSPSAYEADVSSCGTSPEHPSMGDRAAIAQRRADREKRYLETTLEGPDTESDDNSQSALELTRIPAARDSSQRGSETMRNNPANANDFNWPMDPPPATRDNSGVIDAVDFGLGGELPAAKSPMLDRSLIPRGNLRYAVEAIERAPGDSIDLADLPCAVEAIERTPGYMLPAPTENTLEVERPASSSIARSVPSAPTYTMMPMCVAADDVVTLKPKRSDDKGFLAMSSTDSSTDARLESSSPGLLSENALKTGSEEKPGLEKVPRICRDAKFWQSILFPGSRTEEHRQETEDWMNDYFGIAAQDTTYKTCSLDSSSHGFPLQKSPTIRRASWEEHMAARHETPTCSSPVSSSNGDGSPIPFPSTESGLKRFKWPEVESTAYISHGSDDKLISTFIQESPESRASLTPEDTSRSNVQKTVCFAKDVEIIDRHSQFNLSPQKTSPARPAKRLSGAETAKKVQKDLELRNEASVQRLCQRLQEQPEIAQEENEASWLEKPRWRVP